MIEILIEKLLKLLDNGLSEFETRHLPIKQIEGLSVLNQMEDFQERLDFILQTVRTDYQCDEGHIL